MKTTWNRLASVTLTVFTSFTLHAGTYFVQSLGGTDGPPYPFDPTHGTAPMSEIGPDQYYVEDGAPESLESGGMMTMNSLDPSDPSNTNTISGNASPLPNIRNYAKYSQQVFGLLDTNNLASGADTNLYNACAAMPVDTNTVPMLFIQPYAPNAVIIRADNFDYSQTNADFALLICDKVETPTWKTIDFGGASDAQDGWLVQGTVPNWQVSGTMFFLVRNINLTYPAFFRAIPYSGPQVAIIGTNQPYDTVSNTIPLITQVMDLSGTTNTHFEVNVDGNRARFSLATNTVTLDTQYNPNDIHQIYLNVESTPTVYSPTNPPADLKVFYGGSTYIPLYFANDTCLEFASDLADPSIGTNFMLFSINKTQECAAIITDPSNGNVVFAATNFFAPGIVAVPWNFTEGDGVTPYTNDTYAVTFIAFDPATLTLTNSIDRHGVRTAAGNIITYEQEDPSSPNGPSLNAAALTYIDQTMSPMYESLYSSDPFSYVQYNVGDIGPGRDNPRNVFPFMLTPSNVPLWATATLFALTNTAFSDFGYYMGHGNTSTLADGTDWVTNAMPSELIEAYCVWPSVQPNWRMRKVVVWCCFSDGPGFHQIVSAAPNWPEAFGIRDTSVQTSSYITKNVGLFFQGKLPQVGYSGTTTHTSVEVASYFDEFWVEGPFPFPGGCDPSYTFGWAFNMMVGMNPEVRQGQPAWVGFGYLPYSGNFDSQIVTNNVSGIHNH